MEVIGAGLDRTGTFSLHEALKILGYNAYHWEEHIENHLPFWERVYSGEIEHPDFATEYAGVQATTDLPAAYFFEELYQAFPDAKVILTVRDNEEIWYKSYLQHNKDSQPFPFIYKFIAPSDYREAKFIEDMRKVIYGSVTASISKRKYRQHNKRVEAIVPAEKLLVFNVKEGWRPVCEFLGKDIPSESFPFKNQAGYYGSNCDKKKQRSLLRAGLISGGLLIVSVMVWKFLKYN